MRTYQQGTARGNLGLLPVTLFGRALMKHRVSIGSRIARFRTPFGGPEQESARRPHLRTEHRTWTQGLSQNDCFKEAYLPGG